MKFRPFFYIYLSILTAVPLFAQLDKTRYITIDEIETGMPAYCLTIYKGVNVEKFDLEVISVVKKANPGIFNQGGQNTILVMGTDERFRETGPVQGCSGSPVFIDGRLAGALAVGFSFSKEPLYGVTPIEEMISSSQNALNVETPRPGQSFYDFSRPIDTDQIVKAYFKSLENWQSSRSQNHLAIPVMSSFAQDQVNNINDLFRNTGMQVYSAAAASASLDDLEAPLVPGATVACPLVTGDISLSAVGTVTDVVDDRVYAFGHAFLGEGKVNLPMANGYIHTVVSNVITSFKFGQSGQIVGALKTDTKSGVFGEIGAVPPMIDFNIHVNKYNDIPRRFNCQAAVHERLTPMLVNAAIMGTIGLHSEVPKNHEILYNIKVKAKGFDEISYSNIAANTGAPAIVYDLMAMIATLMDNPFQVVEIESIDASFTINQAHKLIAVEKIITSNSNPKPGETIQLEVLTRSLLDIDRKYVIDYKIPEDIQPGQYNINISGADAYKNFIRQMRPNRFTVTNIEELFQAFRLVHSFDNNKLYAYMEVPADGIILGNSELGNLPITKSMVLVDTKRTSQITPYRDWTAKELKINKLIINDMSIQINVEK